MGLRDEIAADMLEIHADLDSPTCTYLGTAYDCIPSGNSRGTTLALGGFEVEIEFSLRIRIDDLGDVVPVAGKRITYAGTEYKIAAAYRDGSGAFFCLMLQDPNR
jgi:hypothetical protein